jgi:hypothetical protein
MGELLCSTPCFDFRRALRQGVRLCVPAEAGREASVLNGGQRMTKQQQTSGPVYRQKLAVAPVHQQVGAPTGAPAPTRMLYMHLPVCVC